MQTYCFAAVVINLTMYFLSIEKFRGNLIYNNWVRKVYKLQSTHVLCLNIPEDKRNKSFET
jgi:hypothetical protein